MIAIVRKNLACLYSNSTHKSSVSSLVAPHLFSTQSVTCPRVYDLLLHKHQFSPELASLVASDSVLQKRPENVDPILSFLKESGWSTSQLQKLVKYKPRILSHSVEDIEFKIKIFHDSGLSIQDTAKIISDNPMILHLTAKSKIVPSLSVLKGLLGCDYDVARLLKRSAWPLFSDLGNTLLPNVAFLKSFGVPMELILYFLYLHPRSLLIKPDVMRKSAEKAQEMGFNESSKMFVHALKVITSMSTGMWEVKLQAFQEMGFSESDSLAMFKKFPYVFTVSRKKMEKVKQLLLATGKINMPSIVNNPSVFGSSIELRIEPRLRILQILENNNLIKWPSLGAISSLSDDKFVERFVRPFPNEVGEAFAAKICVKDKIR